MTKALKMTDSTESFISSFGKTCLTLFLKSLLVGKEKGFLSPSQRQAIIKLLDKNKDKRFIKHWRPISLINYDAKLLSKTLAERLKTILSFIISHDQTAYVANKFLGKSVRWISDILKLPKHKTLMDFYLQWTLKRLLIL